MTDVYMLSASYTTQHYKLISRLNPTNNLHNLRAPHLNRKLRHLKPRGQVFERLRTIQGNHDIKVAQKMAQALSAQYPKQVIAIGDRLYQAGKLIHKQSETTL